MKNKRPIRGIRILLYPAFGSFALVSACGAVAAAQAAHHRDRQPRRPAGCETGNRRLGD